jgi:hypothetical protein
VRTRRDNAVCVSFMSADRPLSRKHTYSDRLCELMECMYTIARAAASWGTRGRHAFQRCRPTALRARDPRSHARCRKSAPNRADVSRKTTQAAPRAETPRDQDPIRRCTDAMQGGDATAMRFDRPQATALAGRRRLRVDVAEDDDHGLIRRIDIDRLTHACPARIISSS